MKLLSVLITSLTLTSCAYATWIEPNPSNTWNPMIEGQAGFTSLGDHASIGNIEGFKIGASNDSWELSLDYDRNEATLYDSVDFTLHNVGVSADRVFRFGLLALKAGVEAGYTISDLGNSKDGSFRGSNGLQFTYGAGIGYSITPNVSIGLSVKERIFETEVRKTVKKDNSEPIFADGVQIGTVETETLETSVNEVNFNNLQTLLSIRVMF